MKNKIMKKLRSKSGASISFALLLFLVCAVLCSVILAAATAAAGRMSRIAQSDQRYYAVTSAAELLKDVFKEEPPVSIVEVVKTPIVTTYTPGGQPAVTRGDSSDPVVYIFFKKASEIREEDLVDGNKFEENSVTIDSIQKEAAIKLYQDSLAQGQGQSLDQTSMILSGRKLDLTTDGHNELAVVISEDLYKNGNIELILCNKYNYKGDKSKAGEQYFMKMLFGVDKSVTERKKTVTDPSDEEGDEDTEALQIKSIETVTTITTLSWNLTGIKTNFEIKNDD